MAPTMLHVGAIRDHPAAYLRRAFRSLVLPTTASDLVQTMTMITFCAKAARSNPRAADLDRQRLARLHFGNDLVDLGAIESAINPQHGI